MATVATETPHIEAPAFIEDMQELMERKFEADRILREEMLSQTWPVWLYPEEFDAWLTFDRWCRKTSGKMLLPSPPPEIIAKVIANGRERNFF